MTDGGSRSLPAPMGCSHSTYAAAAINAAESVVTPAPMKPQFFDRTSVMNELGSAETALAAIQPVLRAIGDDDLHNATPCPGFDIAALGDHLVGTVSQVGSCIGLQIAPPAAPTIEARVSQVARHVVDAWRRRGTDGNVVFSDRGMPARLALGVLSVELVVHGWDFAQAVGRPLSVTAEHADYVLGLARQIITPQSRLSAGFDDPVPIADAAAALDRLVAFTGRTPRPSSPPATSTSLGAPHSESSP